MHTRAVRALAPTLLPARLPQDCVVARSVRCFSADGGERACPEQEPAARPDLSPLRQPECARRHAINAMLRVDHAGETAAVRIYEGQRAVLGQTAEGPLLAEMAEHERLHLERFQRLLPQYRARPSALLPLWSGAAYALGAGSALLGREAAYAVTEAVEDVITAHYNDQLRELGSDAALAGEAELRAVFRAFRDDEQAHLDAAVERDAHKAPFYAGISLAVKAGCRAAIWVCKRV